MATQTSATLTWQCIWLRVMLVEEFVMTVCTTLWDATVRRVNLSTTKTQTEMLEIHGFVSVSLSYLDSLLWYRNPVLSIKKEFCSESLNFPVIPVTFYLQSPSFLHLSLWLWPSGVIGGRRVWHPHRLWNGNDCGTVSLQSQREGDALWWLQGGLLWTQPEWPFGLPTYVFICHQNMSVWTLIKVDISTLYVHSCFCFFIHQLATVTLVASLWWELLVIRSVGTAPVKDMSPAATATSVWLVTVVLSLRFYPKLMSTFAQ